MAYKLSYLINFRVLCFNNDHIHHLEPFYERTLKLPLRKRNQIQILLQYPRGVMAVMDLVMQIRTIVSHKRVHLCHAIFAKLRKCIKYILL